MELLLKNPALKVAMLDSILYAYYIRRDSLSNRISETDIFESLLKNMLSLLIRPIQKILKR